MQRVRKTNELLGWVKQIVLADVQCMEDVRGGAYICQIFHSIFPYDLSKIDFVSKNEYHYERNYKVLQQVFTQYKIDKDFVIDNMLAGEKRRDLFYFLSWIKLHYDTFAAQTNYSNVTYRAVEERNTAIAAARKKRANVMLQAGHDALETISGMDSPRSHTSTSTRSAYSQLSAFTSYTGRFQAKQRLLNPPDVHNSTPFVATTTGAKASSPWAEAMVSLHEAGNVFSPFPAGGSLEGFRVDWWGLGKLPGTLRVIPRNLSWE